MARNTIDWINWVIRILEKDEYTPGELFDILREKHPKYAPSMRTLKYYLRWQLVAPESRDIMGNF